MDGDVENKVAGTKHRLEGKVALVTGAGTRSNAVYPYIGVGAAIALTMAAEGARVAMMDRVAGAVGVTQTWLDPAAAGCVAIVGDVAERPLPKSSSTSDGWTFSSTTSA